MVGGVVDFGEGRDALVVQRCLAHEEGVEVGHHHRGAQGTVHDELGEHGDGVRFAAPDHLPLGVQQVPGQTRGGVRGGRLVQAVDPDRQDSVLAVEVVADRPVELDGAESGPVAHAGERDLVTQPLPFRRGLGVGYGLGPRPELVEAPLRDAKAELVPDALRALLLPPVETLEDARLLPAFPGVVLVDEELGPLRSCRLAARARQAVFAAPREYGAITATPSARR